MGQSQQSSEKPKEYLHNFQDKNRIDDFKDASSYRGIRSDNNSCDTNNNTQESSIRSRSESTSSEASNLVETTVIWKDGGKEVYITGSFSNWKQWFTLERQGDVFCRKILLPKEKHYFKFIVDKDWRTSTSYETSTDEAGNVNNIIDLSPGKIEDKTKKKAAKKATDSNHNNTQSITNNTANTNANTNTTSNKTNIKKDIKKQHKLELQSSYSDLKPERSGLNTDTPMIPCSYSNQFSIDNMSNQEFKGNKHFLRCESHAPSIDSQYTHCNVSSFKIGLPPHVNM
jgi:hypothetical protein